MRQKKQSLDWDFSKLDDSEKVSTVEAYRAKKAESFEKNNEIIRNSLEKFYEEQIDFYEEATADERMMQIARLHAMAEVSGWLIGKFLNEDIMKSGLDAAEYYRQKSVDLPFGRSTMYNYISVNKAVEFDEFLEFGVKATIEVAKVKDDKQRKKIIETARRELAEDSQPKEAVIRTLVEEQIDKVKESEKKIRDKKKAAQKTRRDEVHISITKRGKSISVTPDDDEFDLVLDALHANINRIKDYVLLYKE